MKRTLLGQSGLDVPVFAVGTGAMQGMVLADGVPILRRAYELGATWWDTSDDYGTHPMVAQALADFPALPSPSARKPGRKRGGKGRKASDRSLMNSGRRTSISSSCTTCRVRRIGKHARVAWRPCSTPKPVAPCVPSDCPAISPPSSPAQPSFRSSMWYWHRGIVSGNCRDGGSLMEEAAGIRACYAAGKGVILMKLLSSGRLRGVLDDAIRAGVAFPEKHALDIGVRSIIELETDIRLVLGEPVDQSILEHLKAGERFGHAA